MRKNIFLAVLFSLVFIKVNAQWSKGKGNGYLKLGAWYLQSDQHYTDTGAIDPNVTRTQFNLNLYGEYGITSKLDIITFLPFYSSISQNNQISGTNGSVISAGETVSSLGDIDLGVNYNIYQKNNWAASVKLILGLPTGNDSGGSDGSFQTGDGEFNQYISTYLGYSGKVYDLPFYAKSYLGYNNRSEGFSDEFRTGLEGGINFLENKLWFITRLNILKSLKNGSLNAITSNGSIFANNIEFSSFGFELAYYFTKSFGISANFDSAFDGRIIAANASFSGGIFLDIK
ncbi:hypothetical protein [Tenacibaculum sp. 190524A05c]|uniref:hypothetical protein n=1 Tax=Tenacibaculum platacis TaxID=3137852 RepID=UPI0032B22A0F